MSFLGRALHVVNRTVRFGIGLALEELPERIRFEIQRHRNLDTKVTDKYAWGTPKQHMWRCPDPDYKWHYNIDDLGYFDTWDEAHEAGLQHWRDYHEGRWPGDER